MDSFKTIQEGIVSVLQELSALNRVEAHMHETNSILSDANLRISALQEKLNATSNDIEDLDKISLKALFHKTLGNKEEQLELKRQEFLEHSLELKELRKEKELMLYEKEILSKKLLNKSTLEKKLLELKHLRKEEILRNNQDPSNKKLVSLINDQRHLSYQIKEHSEAIAAGEKSLSVLNSILSHLEKAEDWGRRDMYNNKSRRAKYQKHRSVDMAMDLIPEAQYNLNIFSRELRDLGEDFLTRGFEQIDRGKFKIFFFDNLISDWIVQNRIKNTIFNIDGNRSSVQRILMGVQQRLEDYQSQLNNNLHNQEKVIFGL